jgi:two-component system chemotaxis response regulator CheV
MRGGAPRRHPRHRPAVSPGPRGPRHRSLSPKEKSMSELLKNIDARARLAGTNKLEILLFSLGVNPATGRRETFGINVFKVREVMGAPAITAAPEMPAAVTGMVSLRGALVPVVDLIDYVGAAPETPRGIMIVTEYNGHTQGFLAESVDTILRLDWAQMRVPPDMLTAHLGGLVTAVTELPDDRLVMLLDVERILAETAKPDDRLDFATIPHLGKEGLTVLYADDSSVARAQIQRTLEAMGVHGIATINGRAAWNELRRIADHAAALGRPVSEHLQLILTDVEMPEMDGYLLTRNIKEDPRFNGIPVLMHSSLSSMSNQSLGHSVGVDEYIPKFEPHRLSEALSRRLLGKSVEDMEPLDEEQTVASVAHRQSDTALSVLAPSSSGMFEDIDARTQLAGSNLMEILLFSLGTGELFGINVFKVREVNQTPTITKTPNMPRGVEGLISLRGNVIPVISLATAMGLADAAAPLGTAMMVTEYNKRLLGFLVHEVDRIIRVDWSRVRAADAAAGSANTRITAITELPDGRLVAILDVEQVMTDIFGETLVGHIDPIAAGHDLSVFFADDSAVARKKITEVLDKLGVKHKHAQNGMEAWTRLSGMAAHAQNLNRPLCDDLDLILVDAEMPEMDGYVLTRNIKADKRFDGIPVVMHSSLSSEANHAMGKRVGVDAYVAKFDADALSHTLRAQLTRHARH